MKKYKTIFIIFMILLLVCPVAFANYKRNVISTITNTKLPEFNLRERTTLDKYFSERIFLHDKSIESYLHINDLLFGELEHPSYAYGKNGYVFFRPYEKPLDIQFIDDFCKYIKEVQDYCSQRNVPFIFCINPTKERVYRENLPDGYYLSDKQITYLYKKLNDEGVNYISNIEYLSEVAKHKQIYNKQFDAGHWNDLGAFYGTNRLLSHMKKDYPDIIVPSINDFNVSTSYEKYLPLSSFKINETVPTFRSKRNNVPINITREFIDLEMDQQHRVFEINKLQSKPGLNLPKVLFFAGSYYNRNRVFYNSSFRETYSIHNYENFLNFDYYFNIFQPDYVVFVSAEYTINENFYNPTLLANKRLNMPLSEALNTYSCARFKLPSDLSNKRDIVNMLYDKGLVDFQIDKNGTLHKLSFKNNGGYRFGYFKKNDVVLDLNVSDDKISCTTNRGHATFNDGELYLFY